MANLLLELGFSPEEAIRLQTASKKHIHGMSLLKKQGQAAITSSSHSAVTSELDIQKVLV